MPINTPPPKPSWTTLQNKPTTVAALGVSDFNASAISATASASYAGVGTYSWMRRESGANDAGGNTFASSSLRTVTQGSGTYGTAPAGTWRGMSGANLGNSGEMIFLRIF